MTQGGGDHGQGDEGCAEQLRQHIGEPNVPRAENLSLRKGLGRVTPQAVLIPLLMAPKAAEEAHINPRKLAIPVIVRAFTIPSMVEPINSLETGRTSAIWIANSVLSLSGPMMNAITDTTAKPSGNIENNA